VQVDPIKPTLKAPGTKRLKPLHDEPLSNFTFKYNLRRYKMAKCNQPISCGAFNNDGSIFAYAVSYDWSKGGHDPQAGATLVHFSAQRKRFLWDRGDI